MCFLQEPLVQHNNDDIEIWEFQSEDELSTTVTTKTTDDVNHPSEVQECDKSSILKLLSFICTFLFAWQAVFRIQDGALNVLFKFFSLLFEKVLNFTGSEKIRTLHQHFPSNLKLARNVRSGDYANFGKFIVCQKCYTTYRYEDCLGQDGISMCTYVRFPRHPQKRMRVTCSYPLLKVVKTASGKHMSHPLKLFCYCSIIESLRTLFKGLAC